MKEDVFKFNNVGYVSKKTLSNEGTSRANQLICKKILRIEKEDSPNEAIISQCINDCFDEEYKNPTKLMVPNEGKMIDIMILASSFVERNFQEHLSCKYTETHGKEQKYIHQRRKINDNIRIKYLAVLSCYYY